jgi:3-hydroxy-9,10-secoandrosta-1,3,5(10)-triene-9,17-dione monooxygenase
MAALPPFAAVTYNIAMNTQPAPPSTTAPDPAALIEAARALAPKLRERAAEAEALRRMPDENVAEIRAAGLFKVLQPARCGGWETDFHTHIDTVAALGEGCASTAWCVGVLQIHSWLAGMMTQQAQDDIYADDPETLISAVLNPRGTARRDGYHYVLSGFWPFGSGSEHCAWLILGANVMEDGADEPVDHACFSVPTAEVEIQDDWRVAGLRGTGSCSLVAKDVRVPTHRYISFRDARLGKTPGGAIHEGSLCRAPLAGPLSLALCPSAIGAARGALADFLAYVPGRTNPHLRGAPQIDSPLTHQTVAEATARIDAADLMLHRAADDIHEAAERGGDMTPEIRTRVRMDCAFAVRSCLEAVESLFLACGGSGLSDKNPIQRAWRDLHAINEHATLQWQTNAEIYGRTLLGLEPGSDII